MRVYGAMLARDWELARRHLDRMHERLDVVPMIDVGYYEFLVAWHAAIVGDLSRADRHARQARALAEDAGLPSLVALSSFLTAQLEHERGDRAGAREHLVRVHATAVAQFERMGRTLEARGDVERALGWCLRGLAADELADGLYLGAARCDRTTGRDRSALALLRHAERLREVAVPDSPSRTA